MHLPNPTRALLEKLIQQSALPPDTEVFLFGSRVHGRNLKRYSDIDLCLKASNSLSDGALSNLKHAFENSELPYKVDIVTWNDLAPDFQKAIAPDLTLLFTTAPAPTRRNGA